MAKLKYDAGFMHQCKRLHLISRNHKIFWRRETRGNVFICDSLLSAVQPTWFYEYTVYCIQYANTFLYIMCLINICILYLFDSFYFLYIFTFSDVILSTEKQLACNFGIYHAVFVCIPFFLRAPPTTRVAFLQSSSYMP